MEEEEVQQPEGAARGTADQPGDPTENGGDQHQDSQDHQAVTKHRHGLEVVHSVGPERGLGARSPAVLGSEGRAM
jgi:hypothetical protein